MGMDGWLDGRMGGWMAGWMDVYSNHWPNGLMSSAGMLVMVHVCISASFRTAFTYISSLELGWIWYGNVQPPSWSPWDFQEVKKAHDACLLGREETH